MASAEFVALEELFLTVLRQFPNGKVQENTSHDAGTAAPTISLHKFLLVYRCYGTPKELLDIWQKSYEQAARFSKEVQGYLLEILLVWVETFWTEDFDKHLSLELVTWADTKLKQTDTKNRIKLMTLKKQRERPASPLSGPQMHLLDLPVEFAAQTITRFEFRLFKNIPRSEFLSSTKPNIDRMVRHFNEMCMFITTEILQTKREDQLMIVERTIMIADALEKLGNFNAVMEFIAAWNSMSLHRLAYLWEGLPTKVAAKLKQLEALMDTKGNNQNYRKCLTARKTAVIPYIGIYLKDLIFTLEGNPKLKDGQYNPYYVYYASLVLDEIIALQSREYQLPYTGAFEPLLENLPHLDEEALYALSLQFAPSRSSNSSPSLSRVARETNMMNLASGITVMKPRRGSKSKEQSLDLRTSAALCKLDGATGLDDIGLLVNCAMDSDIGVKSLESKKMPNKKFFVGKEFIEWLLTFHVFEYDFTRENAIEEATQLFSTGVIKSLECTSFVDGPGVYYIQKAGTEEAEQVEVDVNDELVDAVTQHIYENLINSKYGVKLGSKTWLGVKFENSFKGQDLIEWMTTQLEMSKSEAKKNAAILLKRNYISHCSSDLLPFTEACVYRFAK